MNMGGLLELGNLAIIMKLLVEEMTNYTKEQKEFEKEFVDPCTKGLKKHIDFISHGNLIWSWITQVFAKKVERRMIERFEDILENKVKIYAKINFCEECRKQQGLKKNELIMYVEAF